MSLRCLVTGGSRGLGRAVREALARAGARVAFTWNRNEHDAADTLAALRALRPGGSDASPDARAFRGSVADAAHVDATIRAVVAEWGGLDVLVNNAGINQVLPVALIEEADWDAVMDVNAKGTFLFSRAALRPMIRAKRGHIVSIGTFSEGRIVEAPVHYAASKAAVRGMTEALAREVGRYGIQVNLVAPGLMDAGQSRGLPQHRLDEYLGQNPLGRLITPAEVADVVVWLVSGENRHITGARVAADGGDLMADLGEVQARGFDEFVRYVNPLLAQRAQLGGEPWHVVSTDDGRLVDADGRVFEDFHGTQALGHRNAHVTEAVIRYLQTDAPNWYPARVTPYAGRLARMLAERTGYERASFAGSGSEGVEAAMKLARSATRRTRILGLEGAYHGCGMGSTALMAPGPFRDPFGPHLPGVESLPFGDIDALHRAFAGGDVAAVVVEPIQGEGGVRVLPDAYVAALCELTAKHDTFLVADEVQTGLGRTGAFQRSATWPRRPDAVVFAKLLGGGLAATSAMLTSPEWFQRAYGRDFEGGESHNVTFGYNALSMVAGIAALELLDEALMDRITTLGAWFRADFVRQLGDHPLVHEVRGEGLLLGLKLRPLDHPWLSFEHFGFEGLADRATVSPLLCHRLYRHGWFFFTCGHDWSVFRLQPRYHVPKETLERVLVDIRTELDWLLETSR